LDDIPDVRLYRWIPPTTTDGRLEDETVTRKNALIVYVVHCELSGWDTPEAVGPENRGRRRGVRKHTQNIQQGFSPTLSHHKDEAQKNRSCCERHQSILLLYCNFKNKNAY
jgi:hypothetical protein